MRKIVVIFLTISLTIILSSDVTAEDKYELNTGVLTIPYVAVGGTIYQDVKVTLGLGDVISYSTISPVNSDSYDTYNSQNGRLTIPAVTVGSAHYYNVVAAIRVANIISVGPACNIGPACRPWLWAEYSWTKPKTSAEVSAAATKYFEAYVQTVRSPNASVEVIAQDGVDPFFVNVIKQGGNFVAKVFDYPANTTTQLELIAKDRGFYEQTLIDKKFTREQVNQQLVAWDGGAPGWCGVTLCGFNYTVVLPALTTNLSGMYQMAGHELFHPIQAKITDSGAERLTPSVYWFWEGPAQFIGLQTSNYLGFIDYNSIGRKTQTNRCTIPSEKKLKLSEHLSNTPLVDPYGIGEIATELLVANVGMQKFMDIYTQIKLQKNNFYDAFFYATGVRLDDFYSMFEEVRGTLGCPSNY